MLYESDPCAWASYEDLHIDTCESNCLFDEALFTVCQNNGNGMLFLHRIKEDKDYAVDASVVCVFVVERVCSSPTKIFC